MTPLDALRWDQIYADVQTALYRPRIRAFLSDVVQLALAAIDRDLAHWSTTREGGRRSRKPMPGRCCKRPSRRSVWPCSRSGSASYAHG